MSKVTDDEILNESELLKEVQAIENGNKESQSEDQVQEEPKKETHVGMKLNHMKEREEARERDIEMVEKKKLTKIGESIYDKAEYREGWIDFDRALLKERDIFYPVDWKFKIRPATVEAIRNWSTLDDENINSIDEVFNEILKSCVSIITPRGPIPVGNIASWDRFFFLLIVREYTFTQGETKVQWEEECIECENPVNFVLTSTSLMFDLPDEEVMKYYDQETRSWFINPSEFGVEGEEPITLYIPTLERDANVKAWAIARLQENRNRKIDNSFIRFLLWLAPKISKDLTIAQKQIREYEMIYKSWDTEMFSFMDDVLRNIIITPSQKITTVCPICGEEMTSDIRFQHSVRDLFNVSNKFKKFGKK